MWHKKESGPGPKNWCCGDNFKMNAKIRENGYLRKSRISEKSSGLNENCSSSANFWANDPIFLHLKGVSYICVIVAQNCALSLILGPQFWSKVKNSKLWDTPFFRRANFAGPGVGLKNSFGPKNCFAYSICPDLNFDTTLPPLWTTILHILGYK